MTQTAMTQTASGVPGNAGTRNSLALGERLRRKTLRERIAAVSKQVGQIKPTGKNQYAAEAISIDDVEERLQEALAEQGVVVHFTHAEKPMQTNAKGEWMVSLAIFVEAVDDPNDCIQGLSYDTGGNISAAVSFALKRYYKGLLHIGDEVDGHPAARPAATAPATHNNGQTRPTMAELEALHAVTDALGKDRADVAELVRKFGYAAVLARAEREQAAKQTEALPLGGIE